MFKIKKTKFIFKKLLLFLIPLFFIETCAPPKNYKIIVKMLPAQEEYFKKEIIAEFNKQNRVKVEVVHYDNPLELENELAKYYAKTLLVKIPFDRANSLIQKDMLKSLNSIINSSQINEFKSTYLLTSMGMYDGKYYLIPRKFETRIMVYSKSKVADAILRWPSNKDAINEDLKKVNGYGLPATFVFEDDPNKWDFFDVYVAGWIWAHTPYEGKTYPRIAHRGKRYSGTALRIIDRVFECGGDSNQVINMKGDAVYDAFMWEAFYALSVYNKKMWEEQWSGTEIWKGFRDGDVFLAFMTQIDCFFLHGTGQDGLDGYFPNPDDMGVALMPAGCSLFLDKNGNILRTGTKSVTTGGWWWGIPASTPDSVLSYKLARFVTNTSSQIKDCSRFGMIPVRKDILSDMRVMFGGGWITEVYETSFKQLMINKNTILPQSKYIDKISNIYLDA